jgi:transcriptional regulator with XRE-family HTH domain
MIAKPALFGKSDLARLGSVLAEERAAGGLTLGGLAARSRVSVGTIRAIESGRSNPSLATVLSVVEALGLSLDRVVEKVRAARQRNVVVIRNGQPDGADGTIGGAAPNLSDPVLEPQVMTLGSKSLQPPPAEAARHPSFAMVVSGQMSATTNEGARIRLDQGDSYHAEAGQIAAWGNVGPGEVRLLHVVDLRSELGTPPG